MECVQTPFILNQMSLPRLDWVDCDTNAQTVNSFSLIAGDFMSSIKGAAIKTSVEHTASQSSTPVRPVPKHVRFVGK